jgi:translation elongation factor EF-1alpha
MEMLRFITCGSVDDGKSTLIGRLLYETKLIFEDQLEALRADSKKFGTQGERLDFALLVDGLQAEENRASQSMSRIVSSPQSSAASSSPILQVMSNTRVIWQPAHRRRRPLYC